MSATTPSTRVTNPRQTTRRAPGCETAEATRFEVSLRPEAFGVVRAVHGADGAGQVGHRCWEAFGRCAAPCAGCPLAAGEPLVGARDWVLPEGADGSLRIARLEVQGDRATISVRAFDGALVDQIVARRFERLMTAAGLSSQERIVLRHLLEGRQNKEIASLLGISPRTVKFHGHNVLHKLGVGHRTELLGLLHPSTELLGAPPPAAPPGTGSDRLP